MHFAHAVLLPSPAWVEGIVLCLCVCVRVLPQNGCKIISKSKQAISHKLGNLRCQTVVFYKIGKLLQANTA